MFHGINKLKKSVLIVTRNLPPLIGGMERLNWHIAEELSRSNKVILVSHHDAKNLAPHNTEFYGVRLNPLPFFLLSSFFKTLFLCLTKKPDILFAGSGLTAPIVVFWAKIFRKKSIVYIHGLDIATNHWIYKMIWVPMIRSANQVIANSTPTRDICLQKRVSAKKLSIIHPGVSYPPMPLNKELIQSIQDQYQLHGKKILISVGRLTQRKGLHEFVDLALPKIVQAHPNTILVVIGDTPKQSLNKNLQSIDLILETAKKHGIIDSLLFVGNVNDDQVLSSWYYLADIHVFPVKNISSDPEGFGMVAIEAASHGTPTIAFKTGGIIDAIKDQVTGHLVPIERYDLLSQTIISNLNSSHKFKKQDCELFAEQFSWKNLKLKFDPYI